MVNPGSFLGARGAFIHAQTKLYADAVKDNHVADTVADIQRRYFKRFPITLRDNEEPSGEWLAQVKDDAPDEELSCPDTSSMSQDDAEKALAEYADLVSRTKFKKEQIKRRLHYIYAKNHDADSDFDKLGKDPISSIASKLLGVEFKLPRRKTAYNVWGPKHRTEVDPVFNKRIKDLGASKDQHMAIRSAVYKELFEQLSTSEQKKWTQIAEREHEKVVADAKRKFKNSVPSTPEARQRVIAALPKVIEPILDAVCDYTGWKASFIAGGPEPADGGRLNMISIHSGLTAGSVKMDFGRSQKQAYKHHIAPAFGAFLKKCYSVQDCRESALPQDHTYTSLSDVAEDEDISIQLHTFESDVEHENAHRPKRLFEDIAKSGKSTKHSRSPSVSSSPALRFGPPIGKKKLRVLPSKDAALVKLGPSPLSQSFVPGSADSDTSGSSSGQEAVVGSDAAQEIGTDSTVPSTPLAVAKDLEIEPSSMSLTAADSSNPTYGPSLGVITTARSALPTPPATPHTARGPILDSDSTATTMSPNNVYTPLRGARTHSSTAAHSPRTDCAAEDLPATVSAMSLPTASAPEGPDVAAELENNAGAMLNDARDTLSAASDIASPVSTTTSLTTPPHPGYDAGALSDGSSAGPSAISGTASAVGIPTSPVTPTEPVRTAGASPGGISAGLSPTLAAASPVDITTSPTASTEPAYSAGDAPDGVCAASPAASATPAVGRVTADPYEAPASPPFPSSDDFAITRSTPGSSSTAAANLPGSVATPPCVTLAPPPTTVAGSVSTVCASASPLAEASAADDAGASATSHIADDAQLSAGRSASSPMELLPSAVLTATAPTGTPLTAQPTSGALPTLPTAVPAAGNTHNAPSATLLEALGGPSFLSDPASLPPSSPPQASLPPSPQGSPQPTMPAIKFGGAALVPNLSDVEASPTKGRKRRAAAADKDNGDGRATKRLKTAAATPSHKRKAENEDHTPNKRQRGSGSSAYAISPPEGSQPWVNKALKLLTSRDLGLQWRRLVEAWLVFEKAYGFEEKRKPYLPSSGRPEVVGQWIKRGRDATWIPDFDGVSLDEFESTFTPWWRSLQPDWRVEEGEALRRQDGADWDSPVQRSGVNGLLSAVASLFFWGCYAVETPGAASWVASVDDVLYVLQEVVKSS